MIDIDRAERARRLATNKMGGPQPPRPPPSPSGRGTNKQTRAGPTRESIDLRARAPPTRPASPPPKSPQPARSNEHAVQRQRRRRLLGSLQVGRPPSAGCHVPARPNGAFRSAGATANLSVFGSPGPARRSRGKPRAFQGRLCACAMRCRWLGSARWANNKPGPGGQIVDERAERAGERIMAPPPPHNRAHLFATSTCGLPNLSPRELGGARAPTRRAPKVNSAHWAAFGRLRPSPSEAGICSSSFGQ